MELPGSSDLIITNENPLVMPRLSRDNTRADRKYSQCATLLENQADCLYLNAMCIYGRGALEILEDNSL